MSSCEGFGVCDGTWPGGCLGVAGAGFQAAVQDADEAVAELAEGGVVAEPAGALLVVVAAGSGGCGQRGGGGVPITSSTSCDQVIFVDQAIDVSLSLDAVQVEVDRLG